MSRIHVVIEHFAIEQMADWLRDGDIEKRRKTIIVWLQLA